MAKCKFLDELGGVTLEATRLHVKSCRFCQRELQEEFNHYQCGMFDWLARGIQTADDFLTAWHACEESKLKALGKAYLSFADTEVLVAFHKLVETQHQALRIASYARTTPKHAEVLWRTQLRKLKRDYHYLMECMGADAFREYFNLDGETVENIVKWWDEACDYPLRKK